MPRTWPRTTRLSLIIGISMVALVGFWLLGKSSRDAFLDQRERTPYQLFFLGSLIGRSSMTIDVGDPSIDCSGSCYRLLHGLLGLFLTSLAGLCGSIRIDQRHGLLFRRRIARC